MDQSTEIQPNLAVMVRELERGGRERGAQGRRIGSVDHVEHVERGLFVALRGDRQKARLIPLEWIEAVDEYGVYLSKTLEDLESVWGTKASR